MADARIITGQFVTEAKLELARSLRREMTSAEIIFWQSVRGRQTGFKFRRQQVINGYIADFYCHEAKLVLELDGSSHDQTQAYDHARDRFFLSLGLHTIRFEDEEILEQLLTGIKRL